MGRLVNAAAAARAAGHARAALLRSADVRRARSAALQGPQHDALVASLRAEVTALRESAATETMPLWDDARRQLAELILGQDPARFLAWQPIRDTMFVDPGAPFVRTELDALRRDAWEARWRPAIEEHAVGEPAPSVWWSRSSANLIHHAYHVLVWEQTTGRRLQDLGSIVEFGGGYGSFARLVRRLGFPGAYHVHDIPEFSALQRYYMAAVAIEEGDPRFSDGFSTGSSIDALPAAADGSLFVALWSLSETPPQERERWWERLGDFTDVLIAFQPDFEGIDNVRWFEEAAGRAPGFRWHSLPIEQLPGHRYLFGERLPA